MDQKKRVIFLLGSGISFPAKLPDIYQITQTILSTNDAYKATNGFWYLSSDDRWEKEESKQKLGQIRNILERCILLISEYYQIKSADVNYEQIYDALFQIKKSENKEYPNPLISAVRQFLISDFMVSKTNIDHSFWELLTESTDFIEDIVFQKLIKPSGETDYLSGLIDLFGKFQSVVYTLNHDLLIEEMLTGRNIKFVDGFGSKTKNYRPWKDMAFTSISQDLYLLKLHGSLNWYKLGKPMRSGVEILAIPNNIDNIDRFTIYEMTGTKRPTILIGNISKILSYTEEFYLDLLFSFRRNLRSINQLIICGYGFHDQIINKMIIEWLELRIDNNIILISKKDTNYESILNWEIKNNETLFSKRTVRIHGWVEDIDSKLVSEISSLI